MEANGRVRRVGLFGSYARGDWGVGSDLDIVVLVTDTERSFVERPSSFDPYSLPVPVDLVVYTLDEWARMTEEQRGPAADPVRWIRSRTSD
jgi:predicted nucleotidyltransferase